MSGHEDEFEQFREDLEERQALKAELNATVERFSAFLQERGVDVTEYEVKARIAMLAAMKAWVDELYPQMPDAQVILAIKKQLQAHYFILDCEPVWRELVDIEFPGESLQAGDTDIIIREYGKLLVDTEENDRIVEQSASLMLLFLGEQGRSNDDLDDEDMAVLQDLVFLYTVPRLQPQDKFERARDHLIKTGRFDQIEWASLLDHFFRTS